MEVITSCLHRIGSDSKMSAQAWMPVVEVREKRGAGEECKRWNDMVEVAVGGMLMQKGWGSTESVSARESQMRDVEFPKQT